MDEGSGRIFQLPTLKARIGRQSQNEDKTVLEGFHARGYDIKLMTNSALPFRGSKLTFTCGPSNSLAKKSRHSSAFCSPGAAVSFHSQRIQRLQTGNNRCIDTQRLRRTETALRLRACAEGQETQLQLRTAEEVVRSFWELAGSGKIASTLPCFTKDVVYYDVLYTQPFRGKKSLEDHFKTMESVLPSDFVFVLDDVAADTLKVGTRWHVENQSGKTIPFTRGASMYTLVEEEGHLLISEAWDFPETPLKLPGIVLPLLGLAGSVIRLFGSSSAK
ncbi:hypothetical protein BWQ96_00830 [Gracilariopsis chorda]|uniref:SnoaL-like domain-containing protein n=1 Tax=Gracilariopsis chorda TaxID=448386 RepID=A0A2V3J473_9FLOR|nr:hypothetical protein BWQ96_00830 [Gracilariopsis chorda]|eukprot:PXF49256.1 hypothetical protein BWQ96_00830 [Gracilariopsis chorda]